MVKIRELYGVEYPKNSKGSWSYYANEVWPSLIGKSYRTIKVNLGPTQRLPIPFEMSGQSQKLHVNRAWYCENKKRFTNTCKFG